MFDCWACVPPLAPSASNAIAASFPKRRVGIPVLQRGQGEETLTLPRRPVFPVARGYSLEPRDAGALVPSAGDELAGKVGLGSGRGRRGELRVVRLLRMADAGRQLDPIEDELRYLVCADEIGALVGLRCGPRKREQRGGGDSEEEADAHDRRSAAAGGASHHRGSGGCLTD